MKNIVLTFSLFLFLNLSTTIAQNWTLDPIKSKIEWAGKAAFSTYTLGGTLQIKSANIEVVDKGIQAATFIFDMKTIDGENKDLTKHLKSKDFFEVKKYKTAKFTLLALKTDSTNQVLANGNLTIKGTTKAISFPIEINQSDNQLTIKGKAIINRTAYGITYNSPSYFEKLKDHAIADDFELSFNLIFFKTQSK